MGSYTKEKGKKRSIQTIRRLRMEDDKKKVKDPKVKGQMREYDCGYCGHIFRLPVRKVLGVSAYGFESKNNTSSQVRCPRCFNFLKTWDEGKDVE